MEDPNAPPKAEAKSSRRPSSALRAENVADFGALIFDIRGLADVGKFVADVDLPLGNWREFYDAPAPQDRCITAELVESIELASRKGYTVLKDTGCFIAHYQYGGSPGAGRSPHYFDLFKRFYGFGPKDCIPKAGVVLGDWPSNLELSHLCHRRACCRPDHIAMETSWRNKKRNYCGYFGQCDCSVGSDGGRPDMFKPACVRKYTSAGDPSKTKVSDLVRLQLDIIGGGPTSPNVTKIGELRDVLNKTGFLKPIMMMRVIEAVGRTKRQKVEEVGGEVMVYEDPNQLE